MKKAVLPLLLLLLLPGCAPKEATQQFFAMDTTMTITAYGRNADQALTAAQQEVFRLDGLFSRTKPKSDISRLNALAGGEAVALDPETALLLDRAKDLGEITGGALDVTIAPVMDAWGFGAADSFQESRFRVPAQAELDALLPLVDDGKLSLSGGIARLAQAGMAVDLGAVAKGYAASVLQNGLLEAGVDSAVLDLGGNITVLGAKPDGTPWRVGIKDPRDPSAYFCVLSLTGKTASTSGAYERYFQEDGVTYHHIIDPATGYPAETGLLSVTVVSPDGTLADGLSTACFVLGPQRSLALWREAGAGDRGFELVLVGEDGHIFITEGLEAGLDFQGEEAGYTYEIVRR